MAADIGTRNQPPAEQAMAIKNFSTDCVEESWSEYTLDRAVVAWRRSPERFVPTFGQLKECVRVAGQAGGPTHFREMRHALAKLAGMTKPKEAEKPAMSEDEIIASIANMEREKAANMVYRENREPRFWGRFDEMLLKGMRDKLAAMQKAVA